MFVTQAHITSPPCVWIFSRKVAVFLQAGTKARGKQLGWSRSEEAGWNGMISWPKAIASAGRTCLHCSSCTALTPLIGLRMNHIFSPFPPMPHVTWSPCAQAGRWKPKTLLFAVMVLHGLNWPVKLQCSSSWALTEQPFCPPVPALCVPTQTHIHVFISLLLPGETLALGYLSLLLVDITKLSVLRGDALTFTPSYLYFKVPPPVFGNLKFLLVSY